MIIKSAQNVLTLLVLFMVPSLALLGCGTTTTSPQPTQTPTSASTPSTGPQTSADSAVAKGLSIYTTQCKVCHGTNGSGGNGPRLIGKTPSPSYIQANMPRNKPGSLSAEQVDDLVAYITSLK